MTLNACLTRRGFVAAGLAALTLPLAACDASSSGAGKAATTSAASASASTSSDAASSVIDGVDYGKGTHHATIEVADYGTIKVELSATDAPITVANFARLVYEGFYDGLTFHRIIDGFMIQGGDPNGNGTGGSGTTIEGEFESNGHPNLISHVRGTISMARSSAANSASSQFFIMQADSTNLDGQYAAFGHVTEGMEVVDAICADAKPTDNNGTIPASEQPVITSITLDD